MTTSGVTTGLMTARQIAQAVLEQVNYQDPAEAASDADAKTVMRVLNWTLKSLTAAGRNQWRNATVAVSWPGATAEQALSTNYVDVFDCRYQQSATYERPMTRETWDQYKLRPNKSQAGDPLVFCPIKQTGTIRMAIWPVPATTVTLNLDVARVIEDVTSLSQTVDVPQEWTETLYMNVADRLPSSFKAALSPDERRDLQNRAAGLLALLRDSDQPDSFQITPAL